MDHPARRPKWQLPEPGTSAQLTREAVMRRVRDNLTRLGASSWTDVPGDRWREVFSADDAAELSEQLFREFQEVEGRRYYAASEFALRDAPDRYVLRAEAEAAVPAEQLGAGVIGDGDNVFETEDVTGVVFVVREVAEVDRLMMDGVPEGTIGVLDDAGGTLTAPILPDFEAVVCLAGTVRSHLAILAREFGVPTLMGARLARPLRTGEQITVAYSAPAQRVDAYFGEDRVRRAEIRPAVGA